LIQDCSYNIPQFVSKFCADLISKMIRNNPNERISLEGILNHPFLKTENKICHMKFIDSNLLISIEKFSELAEKERKKRENGIYSPFIIKEKMESDSYDFFQNNYKQKESSRRSLETYFNITNRKKFMIPISLVSKSSALQPMTFKAKSPSY
jgi:serine/threonine protein kinase